MKLLAIYLVILLIGIVLYTAFRKTANPKALYLKFFSFAISVSVVYYILHAFPGYSVLLYSAISIVGLYEIIKTTRQLRSRYVYIAVSLFLFLLFISTAGLNHFPHSSLFLCVLSFDAFSQLFGKIFGKRSLARTVSPNKTLEGFIGGLLICLFTSYMVLGSVWKGFLIAFPALGGDLLASLVKRRAGVKDFSQLLPGQGGILDRFDSYIVTAVFYIPIVCDPFH